MIVAAATLVAFPLPPRQLGAADEAAAATPCQPSCPLPAAGAEEISLATHVGPDIAGLWLRRDRDQLLGTVRLLNIDAKPVDGSIELAAGSALACGTGCWQDLSASERPPARGHDRCRWVERTVALPASWAPSKTGAARALLARAQRSMRELRTARLDESVTSGLGQTVRTRYRFRAPDRMAYTTDAGVRLIALGKTVYDFAPGGGFTKRPFGADGFHFAEFFNWRIYARSARWLGGHGRFVKLGIFDQGTPVWERLTVDRRTDRVVEERLVAPGHFMLRRWFAFNQPERIVAPR